MTSSRAADSAASRAATRSRSRDADAQAQADARRRKTAQWRQEKGVDLARGEVMIYSDEIRVSLRARLGDGFPHRIPAASGWEDEQLPGQTAATVFRGAQATDQLPLSLILGGYPTLPKGILAAGQQIALLRELGLQDPRARRGKRPPLVKVRGAGIPHGGDTWFIESIEPDTDPRAAVRVRDRLMRARVTVTLRQHNPPELVILDEDRDNGRSSPWRRYKVPRGQGANEIARDEIGARGSGEIRATVRLFRWADGPRRGKTVRDPKAIRAGDLLWIPTQPLSFSELARGLGAVIA